MRRRICSSAWHIPTNALNSFFGSYSTAKTSRLSYRAIYSWPPTRYVDSEKLESGSTAVSTSAYQYTLIIGARIQGGECYLEYICPIKSENQHILVTRTRNYAPKPPPLSGF